jgi:diguanylate cyclase
MKIKGPDPNGKLPENPEQRRSLTKVLVQSEHVENLVKESAEELSSVNTGIKQALVNQGSVPGVENALEKSEAVEGKVQEASDKLAVVNQALKDEVKGRHVLEDKLSEVTEQGKVDRQAALHDHLTGLPNRALFCDRLEHGVQQARRHDRTLAELS